VNPFVSFFVSSWAIVLLLAPLFVNVGRVIVGATSYSEAKPIITIILLCLAVAFEFFGRIVRGPSR
jgi:hypothetical protein